MVSSVVLPSPCTKVTLTKRDRIITEKDKSAVTTEVDVTRPLWTGRSHILCLIRNFLQTFFLIDWCTIHCHLPLLYYRHMLNRLLSHFNTSSNWIDTRFTRLWLERCDSNNNSYGMMTCSVDIGNKIYNKQNKTFLSLVLLYTNIPNYKYISVLHTELYQI